MGSHGYLLPLLSLHFPEIVAKNPLQMNPNSMPWFVLGAAAPLGLSIHYLKGSHFTDNRKNNVTNHLSKCTSTTSLTKKNFRELKETLLQGSQVVTMVAVAISDPFKDL